MSALYSQREAENRGRYPDGTFAPKPRYCRVCGDRIEIENTWSDGACGTCGQQNAYGRELVRKVR